MSKRPVRETRGKQPLHGWPSKDYHRLWRVSLPVTGDEENAKAKVDNIRMSMKKMIDTTIGTKAECRWWLGVLSWHPTGQPRPGLLPATAMSTAAPVRCCGAGPSTTALSCAIHDDVTKPAPIEWSVLIHLVCGTGGKRKSAVKAAVKSILNASLWGGGSRSSAHSGSSSSAALCSPNTAVSAPLLTPAQVIADAIADTVDYTTPEQAMQEVTDSFSLRVLEIWASHLPHHQRTTFGDVCLDMMERSTAPVEGVIAS